MASPQLENGFTPIANELLEALARTAMSSYQSRCVLCLIRLTYGFKKKSDSIALSQFASATGVNVPHVCRTLKELTKRRIVTKNGNKWLLNKDWSQWRELPKLVKGGKVTNPGQKVTKNGKEKLPIQADSKEKRNTSKERRVTKNGNFYDWRNVPHPMASLPECTRCHTAANKQTLDLDDQGVCWMCRRTDEKTD